jgi:DNA-3-methyladenine glycosylase II
MSRRIDTEADIAAGLRALLAADPRLAEVAAIAGTLPPRRRPGGLAELPASWCPSSTDRERQRDLGRLAAAYDPFTPQALIRARADRLGRLGLSAAKIRTLKEIARAIAGGALDCDALSDMPADAAHQALCAIHGIGPWTADIYLLFCLGHTDAWPAGDLALQEAARLAFGLPARPTHKEIVVLAEPWRPWRGVAARLLWSYYRAIKARRAVAMKNRRTGPTTQCGAEQFCAVRRDQGFLGCGRRVAWIHPNSTHPQAFLSAGFAGQLLPGIQSRRWRSLSAAFYAPTRRTITVQLGGCSFHEFHRSGDLLAAPALPAR